MKRVLIIKLGYSETLDSALSSITSLGDVLRTTVILHFFKKDDVSWLADRQAYPLLENNKYIKKIWIYSPHILSLIRKEKFDVIVNLEKSPDVCQLSDFLSAKEYFGFRFDRDNHLKGYSGNKRLIEISLNFDKRRRNKDCWQKILAQLLEKSWHGEPYILGYKPRNKIIHDIGFNWTTSSRWTNKAWPKQYWYKLEDLIKGKYSLSWQQGLNNLYKYMDWINSCRLIVTADTLGAHLALALKKKVVILFGPTPYQEIYLYNLGLSLVPKVSYKCIPCLKPYCDRKNPCMNYIYPQEVKRKVEEELKR